MLLGDLFKPTRPIPVNDQQIVQNVDAFWLYEFIKSWFDT